MRAVLFPGQGSQYVGMGTDFYKKFDIVKKIFETVDKTLNFSLSNIILNGPEEELKLTQNTQPAIMTVGVCIFKVLKTEEWGLKNFSRIIKNNKKGFYFHIKFEGIGKTIEELEKAENIDQALIRFLTVRVKKHDLKIEYFELKGSQKDI